VPDGEVFPKIIVVGANEKGWMTGDMVKEWIQLVWQSRSGALLHLPSLAVLNSYMGHQKQKAK
jgi:hypothetical protein